MQGGKGSLKRSEAPRAEPQCESLFKLFDGALGPVELGRLLKGSDAGRLVALRRLPSAPSPDLASAVDLARSVAHPRLAKVLGSFVGRGAWYVASEYIAGVTLFELGEAVAKQGTALDAGVAARLVLDTLTAAADAQRLLATTANLHDVRCVFAESIWIASYGEVFISELLIASLLAEGDADTLVIGSLPAARADLSSAGAALARLLGVGVLTNDAAPDPGSELSEVLRRLQSEGDGYRTLQEPIVALSALGVLADEQRVSEEIERVLGLVLERRNQKISLLERGATEASDDDQTRYFRVASPPERGNTTRPPEALERRDTTRPPEPLERGDTTRPPEALSELDPGRKTLTEYSANSDGARTEPPAPPAPTAEITAILGSAAALPAALRTPHGTLTQVDADGSENHISDVWRLARERLDSSAQRAKQQGRPPPDPERRRVAAKPRPLSERAARLLLGEGADKAERVVTLKVALAIVLVLALALVIRALW